jgi:hypothetical protein
MEGVLQMSTTPRTDEQTLAYRTEDGSAIVHASFAAELETELAAARVEVERLRKRNELLTDHYECKMNIPERVSNIETELTAMQARAELAEASAKLWEADALRYANNTEFWKDRAEKAEAALQKILNVMRQDSNGKDPMDAVEDIIIATKEASQ